MNKYLLLTASLLIFCAFGYTLPVTITNPSGSNLAISGVLGLITLGGLWTFFRAKKNEPVAKVEINGQMLTPVD